MNDLTDATGGTVGEANGDTTALVENTSEATADQQTGAENAGQADDAGEATEEAHQKRVPWFQKRIDEVTRQKYDAQREADYWRGVAEGRVNQSAPQQQQEGPPDRWEDPDGYDRWLISQAKEAAKEEFTRAQSTRTYAEREAAIRSSKPDYDSVVRDPSLPITQLMAEVIRESEKGPEVAYYLGTNRSEAARIAQLPPHLQAAALGRIEATFNAPPPAPQTNRNPPPPPPKTVNGLSAGIGKDPNDMSMAEYVAARKAGTI